MCPSVWDCLDVSSASSHAFFLNEHYRNDAGAFSVSHVRRYMIPIYPITGSVNFNH